MKINDYLAELERELRRRRAPRVRVLREVEDHLHDLSAELAVDGLTNERAEALAVRQFGAAAAVAVRFAEATASTAAHRAVATTAAAFVAYAGVFVTFATAASPQLRDFPQGAASFFALQLAAVALVVTAVRSLRWRSSVAAPTAELKAIARGLSLACVALVSSAIGESAIALSRPAGVIAWSGWPWLTLAFAAAFGMLLLSTILSVHAAAQAQAIDRLPSRRPNTTAAAMLAEDVDTLLDHARLPQAGRVIRALLARPWPTALALAALASIAVSAAVVADSGGSGVAGAAVVGAVEATLIVVSFLMFGRTLGLRDPTRGNSG